MTLRLVLAFLVAVAPTLARAEPPADAPRAVELDVGAPAPFKGHLLDDAKLRELDDALTAVERERNVVARERDLWKAEAQNAGGVPVMRVAGVVVVVSVVVAAVAFTAGVFVATGAK